MPGVAGYEHASWSTDALPDEVAVIHLLAVAVEACGRGMVRAMLSFAAQEARRHGMRAVWLDVFTSNAPALTLYARETMNKSPERPRRGRDGHAGCWHPVCQ